MDTDINSLAYETVREVQPNTPLTSKDLSISLGSKNPNIPPNVCKYERLTLLGILVLKLYANAIQSPVHYYQII